MPEKTPLLVKVALIVSLLLLGGAIFWRFVLEPSGLLPEIIALVILGILLMGRRLPDIWR
jgi:hypothetical protein